MNKKRVVSLVTFLSWGKCEVIGHSTSEENGKQLVTKVWCKVCSKHKTNLVANKKGAAKTSVEAFTDGTTTVTKFGVSTINFYCQNWGFSVFSFNIISTVVDISENEHGCYFCFCHFI